MKRLKKAFSLDVYVRSFIRPDRKHGCPRLKRGISILKDKAETEKQRRLRGNRWRLSMIAPIALTPLLSLAEDVFSSGRSGRTLHTEGQCSCGGTDRGRENRAGASGN